MKVIKCWICISIYLLSFGCADYKKNEISTCNLRCEYKITPLGVEVEQPTLGWELLAKKRNQKQRAYHILVSDDMALINSDEGNYWDSGKIESDNSILVNYAGLPLNSGEKYFWKVKVWNQDGEESEWSKTTIWQMGLLNEVDWGNAHWIGYEELPDSMRLAPGNHGSTEHLGNKALKRPVTPLFRKEFSVNKKIKEATLFISGLGHYEACINSKKVGDGFLTPGWTYYDKTVLYNIYDVTDKLKRGENAIGVIVGNGFHNINRERYFKICTAFGMPKMIARLKIKYKDGTEDNVDSDITWKTSPSPITFNSIYGGEDYDARLEQPNWDLPGFDDSNWVNALAVKKPLGKLKAETDYPLAVMEELHAKKVVALPDNSYSCDFGQNASGIVEIKVKGKKGQEVRLIPGELLKPDNTVKQSIHNSGAPYYLSYILKGDGVETWRPRFTYYGFRYVQVNGAVPDSIKSSVDLPKLISLKMLHTRNSSPEVGHFECSHELINKINSLIMWSIRSNQASVLTDCPHREKLGWIGANHVVSDATRLNYDIFHLNTKAVGDMMDAQTPEGLVPAIAPEYALMDSYFGDYRDAPDGGSAAIIVPWQIYKWYGDTSLMAKAWSMMVRYVEYLKKRSEGHIIVHGLGDWGELNPNPAGPRITPTPLTNTAHYYYDLKLLAQMAEILGKQNEKNHFSQWAEEVKKAFNKKFFNNKDCIYATGSQASLAMPLVIGLVEEQYRDKVVNNLINKIHSDGNIMTVGATGLPYLVQALINEGASQLLYDINNRNDAGYGLQLKMGATSLTEPWIPHKDYGSNNHSALGSTMLWFYQGLAGIKQEQRSTAYKDIIISPQFVEGINKVKANYKSPYGMIKSEWEKQEGELLLNVEIPVNTTAKVHLPVGIQEIIKEKGTPINAHDDIELININQEMAVCKIGSGKYSFKINLKH